MTITQDSPPTAISDPLAKEVLNKHLSSRRYFLGDDFSALDVLLGGGLHFMIMAKLVRPTPVLTAYAARITDRPAYRKMMGEAKG